MKSPILVVAGARPNFMKVAPLMREFKKRDIEARLLNTGQHFDNNMAGDFFKEFDIYPDFELSPSHDSNIQQFAEILEGIEKIIEEIKPKLVIVVGDVDSTLAAAITAKKMGIKVAHVEAGLRSFNQEMPEETNRILTDHVSDMLFVTMEEGVENLNKEGIKENVYEVGNIMIDTLEMFLSQVEDMKEDFYFCTLHRAENVDDEKIFNEILDALEVISRDHSIYLPLHPRTKKRIEEFGLKDRVEKIFKVQEPLSYSSCLAYQKNAKLVLTDSGGIQEETSYLGVPCMTLRKETERPITVSKGTNVIAGVTKDSILDAYRSIDLEKRKTSIPLWDGETAKRIVDMFS